MNADEIVRAARELCEKATPGPWEVNQLDDCFIEPRICEIPANGCYDYEMFEANSMFIARSRALIPELCDLIESLQAQLAEKIHIKLRTDEDMLTPAEAIETINRLRKAYRKTTAQLIESQCREKAAVELIDKIRNDATGDWGFIMFLIDKWRGPQEAEIGAEK